MSRTRRSLGVSAVAVTSALALSVVPAQAEQQSTAESAGDATSDTAAEVPNFLEADEIPSNEWEWMRSGVQPGTPFSPCGITDTVPNGEDASHLTYFTESDTMFQQVVVDTADEETAAQFTGALEENVRDCAADLLTNRPGTVVGWDDHGPVDADNTSHVYSVFTSSTANPGFVEGVDLFAVGHSGSTVTMTRWFSGETDLPGLPTDEFADSLVTAVDRLSD